jgi:hypothetical protein
MLDDSSAALGQPRVGCRAGPEDEGRRALPIVYSSICSKFLFFRGKLERCLLTRCFIGYAHSIIMFVCRDSVRSW